MKRKRYKYILSREIHESDKLSDFRLVSANKLDKEESDAIRIVIPDSIKLISNKGDGYQTVSDKENHITIGELEYDRIVKFNKKWKVFNKWSLEECQPFILPDKMADEGYELTEDGYLTEEEYSSFLNEYFKDRERQRRENEF